MAPSAVNAACAASSICFASVVDIASVVGRTPKGFVVVVAAPPPSLLQALKPSPAAHPIASNALDRFAPLDRIGALYGVRTAR